MDETKNLNNLDEKVINDKENNGSDTKISDEVLKIQERYPDRIPVIVNKNSQSTIADIDKKKYLVPNELTMGQFMYVVRKRIAIAPEQAIYLFVNGNLPTTSEQMNNIYDKYKSEDGFLYVTYSGENTFGK
jgi:GABA(A) receptor-associated protein